MQYNYILCCFKAMESAAVAVLLTKQQENSFADSLEDINQLIPADCKEEDTITNFNIRRLE